MVEGISFECLIAIKKVKNYWKGLADGRADSSILGTEWMLVYQTKYSKFHLEFF